MTAITVADLTAATLAGTGVFDVLMRANKAQLEAEFSKGRIKGPEYATVYLGSLESVMSTSLAFLLQKEKVDLEAQLLAKQLLLADKQLLKAQAEIAQVEAQTLLITQQRTNLVDELLTAIAQRTKITQETTNLVAEALNIPKQGVVLDKQALDLVQKTLNAIIEGTVLTAQHCKLTAEFDVLMLTKDRTIQETALVLWKTNTEKAQTLATGVDENSVLGKQKALYGAQTIGFARDAEQKAAKLMVDTWNVRRNTDEETPHDMVNMLHDSQVGRAVIKLLTGINA